MLVVDMLHTIDLHKSVIISLLKMLCWVRYNIADSRRSTPLSQADRARGFIKLCCRWRSIIRHCLLVGLEFFALISIIARKVANFPIYEIFWCDLSAIGIAILITVSGTIHIDTRIRLPGGRLKTLCCNEFA